MTPALERFLAKISISHDGCWEWTAHKNKNNYSRFFYDGDKVYGHRFIYKYFFGEIPKGLEIDHLCRNRDCVNPIHLEAVTHKENNDRGNSLSGINSRKTHCVNGHEFTPENTSLYDNQRKCKICSRLNNANRS